MAPQAAFELPVAVESVSPALLTIDDAAVTVNKNAATVLRYKLHNLAISPLVAILLRIDVTASDGHVDTVALKWDTFMGHGDLAPNDTWSHQVNINVVQKTTPVKASMSVMFAEFVGGTIVGSSERSNDFRKVWTENLDVYSDVRKLLLDNSVSAAQKETQIQRVLQSAALRDKCLDAKGILSDALAKSGLEGVRNELAKERKPWW